MNRIKINSAPKNELQILNKKSVRKLSTGKVGYHRMIKEI